MRCPSPNFAWNSHPIQQNIPYCSIFALKTEYKKKFGKTYCKVPAIWIKPRIETQPRQLNRFRINSNIIRSHLPMMRWPIQNFELGWSVFAIEVRWFLYDDRVPRETSITRTHLGWNWDQKVSANLRNLKMLEISVIFEISGNKWIVMISMFHLFYRFALFSLPIHLPVMRLPNCLSLPKECECSFEYIHMCMCIAFG